MSLNADIDVINAALILVGSRPGTSVTENTKVMQFATARYDSARDLVLASAPWNSATKRVTLNKLSTTPVWGFSAEHQLPADFLRLIRLEGTAPPINFRIEGRKVISNETTINILYIYKMTVVQDMDELLKNAIATRLAAEIALAVKADKSQADGLFNLAEKAALDAMYIDALQAPTDQFVGNTWDLARRQGTETYRAIASATS